MKQFFLAAIMAAQSFMPPACAQSLLSRPPLSFASLDAYSQRSRDAFSFSRNPASLPGLDKSVAGIYAERRFMMEESGLYVMSFATPTSLGHFGAEFSYAGFSLYHEQSMSVAYARSLGRKIQSGLRFQYHGYSISGYGGAGIVSGEIGILIRPGPSWTVGFSAMNPVGSQAGQKATDWPNAVLSWGLGADVSEQLYAMVEARKETNRPVVITSGIQYMIQRQFFLKAGFQSASGTGFAGAGFVSRKYRIDITGSYHPWLGFSPAISYQLMGKRQGHA